MSYYCDDIYYYGSDYDFEFDSDYYDEYYYHYDDGYDYDSARTSPIIPAESYLDLVKMSIKTEKQLNLLVNNIERYLYIYSEMHCFKYCGFS